MRGVRRSSGARTRCSGGLCSQTQDFARPRQWRHGSLPARQERRRLCRAPLRPLQRPLRRRRVRPQVGLQMPPHRQHLQVSASGGAAASPGSGGAPASPGGTAVIGREAATLAPTAGRTVGSPASGAAANAAALPSSASSSSGGVDASPRAGASLAAAASAAVARRAAPSAGVNSVKQRKGRGSNSLQTKQDRFTTARNTVPGPGRFMTPRPHNAAAGELGYEEEDAACGTGSSDFADGDLA